MCLTLVLAAASARAGEPTAPAPGRTPGGRRGSGGGHAAVAASVHVSGIFGLSEAIPETAESSAESRGPRAVPRGRLRRDETQDRAIRAWLQSHGYGRAPSGPKTRVRSTLAAPAGGPLPNAPTLGGPFQGITSNQSGAIPPDSTIAAGPSNLVVATNNFVRVFNKNGTPVMGQSQSLSSFFSMLGQRASDSDGSAGPYDPKVVYDEYIQRFWLIAVTDTRSFATPNPKRSSLLVGLSDTSDAAAGWTLFALDAALNGNDDSGYWCDYPKIGIDAQAVYFTCNMFEFDGDQDFQYSKIRVMTKDQFLNRTGLFWWDFWNLRESELGIQASFSIQPAHMYGAVPATGEFLVDAHIFCVFCPPGTLEVFHITNAQRCCVAGAQSEPDLNQEDHGVGDYPNPSGGRQSGSTVTLDTGDTRLLFAFWKDGLLSTGQNLGCDGDSCIAFTELNVAGFPTISTVSDFSYTNSGVDYFYPAVDVNAAGDKTMVFNRSSPSEFAGVNYVGIPNSSSCTNCVDGPETVLRAGNNAYVNQGCPPDDNRWGDYSGAAADPDGTGIWIHGEFAFATGSGTCPGSTTMMQADQWATAVGVTYEGLDRAAPTTVASVSPPPNGAGWNPDSVTVTLTATDGAGGSGVKQITYRANGAQSIPMTVASGAAVSFPITAEGQTTVTFFAEDNAGNRESPHTVTVRIDRTPPSITAPPDVTAATGPGATTCSTVVSDAVLGSASASDNSGIVTVDRMGVPPGNDFPVGITIVTYTATDVVGRTASDTQQVTVTDGTPPVVATPPDLTVDATSPAGAVVTYPLPTATDNCPGVSIACTPPSGTAFPIGTTTVTCTAADAVGGTTSVAFVVHVRGAGEQTDELKELIERFGIHHGITRALEAKLSAALAAIEDGRDDTACNVLAAFIRQVQAQSGKKITLDQAAQLIEAADRIRAVLGCAPADPASARVQRRHVSRTRVRQQRTR